MDTELDYGIEQRNDGHGNQSIIIDAGKYMAAVAICAAFAALGVGLSVHATYVAQQAAMEARLFQEKANKLQGQFEAIKEHYDGH